MDNSPKPEGRVQPRGRMLVIGGSGELGQQLVAAASRGWQVHATYFHHPPETNDVRCTGWHKLDVSEPLAVQQLMRAVKPQAVIHVAVSDRTRDVVASDEVLRDVTVRGAWHVAEAAREVGARCIVLSTDLVFDGRKGNYVEPDPPNPLMPYAQAKAEMERTLLAADVDLVVVRTSLILNLEPMGRHVSWIVDALRRGERLDLFTDELRCPTWGDELAAALLELTRLDYRGLLHLAGPEATNRFILGRQLAAKFNLDASSLAPALSAASGLNRPLNCTLDSSRAARLLTTRLHGPSLRLSCQTVGVPG
jgi:dTDP-4-dehydrorhamnose reductase